MEYAQGFKVPTGFVRCVKMNVALDVIENRMHGVTGEQFQKKPEIIIAHR